MGGGSLESESISPERSMGLDVSNIKSSKKSSRINVRRSPRLGNQEKIEQQTARGADPTFDLGLKISPTSKSRKKLISNIREPDVVIKTDDNEDSDFQSPLEKLNISRALDYIQNKSVHNDGFRNEEETLLNPDKFEVKDKSGPLTTKVDEEASKNIGTSRPFTARCSFKRFLKAYNLANDSRKKLYDSSIFGSISSVKWPMELDHNLLHEMLRRFDVDKVSFRIGGINIPFTAQDIADFLGLKNEGIIPRLGDKENDSSKSHTRHKYFQNGFKLNDALSNLNDLSYDNNPELDWDFVRLLTIVLMGSFLFPQSNYFIHDFIFLAVDNMKGMEKFNWPISIHAYLVSGMKELIGKKGTDWRTGGYLKGCTMLLKTWFLEKVNIVPPEKPTSVILANKWDYSLKISVILDNEGLDLDTIPTKFISMVSVDGKNKHKVGMSSSKYDNSIDEIISDLYDQLHTVKLELKESLRDKDFLKLELEDLKVKYKVLEVEMQKMKISMNLFVPDTDDKRKQKGKVSDSEYNELKKQMDDMQSEMMKIYDQNDALTLQNMKLTDTVEYMKRFVYFPSKSISNVSCRSEKDTSTRNINDNTREVSTDYYITPPAAITPKMICFHDEATPDMGGSSSHTLSEDMLQKKDSVNESSVNKSSNEELDFDELRNLVQQETMKIEESYGKKEERKRQICSPSSMIKRVKQKHNERKIIVDLHEKMSTTIFRRMVHIDHSAMQGIDDDAKKILEYVTRQGSNRDEVVLKSPSTQVLRKCICDLLTEGRETSNHIIDAFADLLRDNLKERNDDSIFIFHSDLTAQIVAKDMNTLRNVVGRNIGAIKEARFFIIPIGCDHHWHFLFGRYDNKSFVHYDSFQPSNYATIPNNYCQPICGADNHAVLTGNAVREIVAIAKGEQSTEWKFIFDRQAPQQEGGSNDCGIYLMRWMEAAADTGRPRKCVDDNFHQLRGTYAAKLLSQKEWLGKYI